MRQEKLKMSKRSGSAFPAKAKNSGLDFKPFDDPMAAGAIGEEDVLKGNILDLASPGIKLRER
ncbi:hypothetical protein NEPTK9_000963 [Candidatus Neptunochlamydia vexilliferae]|uniref:Uncharacterized protein n=1 Tax=Candidatus Neptunichlamydia vexilliferae TaxID=1651774 RepID=A0ABS0AZA4_9BACT|nr:hypothetical protein [Candidatus Neptunochlamydia vexilliferae]